MLFPLLTSLTGKLYRVTKVEHCFENSEQSKNNFKQKTMLKSRKLCWRDEACARAVNRDQRVPHCRKENRGKFQKTENILEVATTACGVELLRR